MTDARRIIIRREHDDTVIMPRPEIVIVERGFNEAIQMAERSAQFNDRRFGDAVAIPGHEYVALIPPPIIMTGPTVIPDVTFATLYWTTDVPAYHRVRTKESAGASYDYGAWTLSPDVNAAVVVSPLDPEHESYFSEVQSAIDIAEPLTYTAWTLLSPAYYYTLCSGTYGMANWNARKTKMGKLEILVLSWTTTVDMTRAQIDSSTTPYGPWNSYDKTHSHNFEHFQFNQGTYYWRTRNRNKCYVYCPYSSWKMFKVNAAGEIWYQEI